MFRLSKYTLSDNIIKRMKKLVERSVEINKEMGFQLCADIKNPNIPLTTGIPCV